jgi:hypothetical protein
LEKVYVAEFYVFEVFLGCSVCFEGLLGRRYREVLHHEVGVEDQEAVGYCFVEGCYEAGYFLEGHVPLEAVGKLLNIGPAVDGIALPGMPAGSPGMGGVKTEPFTIYSSTNGVASVFMRL